jgi:hypothetical protein
MNQWVTTIKEWINKLGIGHLNFNINNIKFYINSIQQRIQDQAKQNMNSLINVGEKFLIPNVAEKNILYLVEEKKKI